MREITAYFRSSHEHLRKMIHKLAKSGYLYSRHGRGGEIVLGVSAKQVCIGDVILAMEEDMSIVDCDALDCVLSPGCSLKAALNRGSRAFLSALNEVTPADLLHDPRMKRQFKNITIAIDERARPDSRDLFEEFGAATGYRSAFANKKGLRFRRPSVRY